MQWNEWIGQNCYFITLYNSVFFHVACKRPTTAKMHKIFVAQEVLSLATIRSKYYFNFILNRTRSGRELFDHPSYSSRRVVYRHSSECYTNAGLLSKLCTASFGGFRSLHCHLICLCQSLYLALCVSVFLCHTCCIIVTSLTTGRHWTTLLFSVSSYRVSRQSRSFPAVGCGLHTVIRDYRPISADFFNPLTPSVTVWVQI